MSKKKAANEVKVTTETKAAVVKKVETVIPKVDPIAPKAEQPIVEAKEETQEAPVEEETQKEEVREEAPAPVVEEVAELVAVAVDPESPKSDDELTREIDEMKETLTPKIDDEEAPTTGMLCCAY